MLGQSSVGQFALGQPNDENVVLPPAPVSADCTFDWYMPAETEFDVGLNEPMEVEIV